MADNKGTKNAKEGCSKWFIMEAACSDIETDLEKLFEDSTDSDISDLIDDENVEQGNSRELFQQQESQNSEEQLQKLKRKYLSPKAAVAQLSPRLESISISPKQKSKRRLFTEQDSGLELTLTNEAEDISSENVEVPTYNRLSPPAESSVETRDRQCVPTENSLETTNYHFKELLRSNNIRNTLLAKFKVAFDVSFNELTRQFKSHKTCCTDWVAAVYGVNDDLFEGAKQLLQQYCHYVWALRSNAMSLFLLCFKAGKNRCTVLKLLTGMLCVREEQILAEPPKIRSAVAAIFWYQGSNMTNTYTHGSYPKWIVQQTLIGHQTADATNFDFSKMVQWAFDQNYCDEGDIAYHYAKLAPEDLNAVAWLAHNSQAKFVRECAHMVRYYKRGQMRDMSISEWIYNRIQEIEGTGHWSHIVRFIRYQNINFIMFLAAFKDFLHSVPKHNCILIHGPPNTGKSVFCMSLIRVLHGKVISFVNSKSQFWLQPLSEGKIALLDDATDPCWLYIDQYLRNGLDGHPVSLDCKHKAPMQIKFPPLLITSNIDIKSEIQYKYLHSRIQCFKFPNTFPFNSDNTPQFELTDQSWKSFFERLWHQLDLSDQEEEEDGESQRAFQCSARPANEHL